MAASGSDATCPGVVKLVGALRSPPPCHDGREESKRTGATSRDAAECRVGTRGGAKEVAVAGPSSMPSTCSKDALYRMKKETVRPQDRLDAAAIRKQFDLAEED